MRDIDGHDTGIGPMNRAFGFLKISGACLAALVLSSCLEPEEFSIAPGRYYPVPHAQNHPDSTSHYYEFTTDAEGDAGANRYVIVERRSPDCVIRREHGGWAVTRLNSSAPTLRLTHLQQFTSTRTVVVDGVSVTHYDCLTDSTPGSGYEDHVTRHEIRAITATSFEIEACAGLSAQVCADVPVNGGNWARYER